MLLETLLDLFLEWCARHRAPKTVQFYRDRLRAFREKFGKRKAASLGPLEIDKFLHEAGEGLSSSTRRHNAVAITSLQNFAVREKLLKRPWTGKLEKPPMGRRERVPTPEEVAKLLEHASPAFRLIYVGMLYSGARPGELCAATIGQIDRERGAIVLEHHKTARKTGKPRVIPLGAQFGRLVEQAIAGRSDPSERIFLDPRAKPWEPDVLSGSHRRLRDAAGLDKAIVLYSARHKFATDLLLAKVPIKEVSELLGHTNTNTTERYVHVDATDFVSAQGLVPQVPIDPPPQEPEQQKPAA